MHLFLAFSCLNDYFHADAIIYFLANRLVFQNMVTYNNFCIPQISTVNSPSINRGPTSRQPVFGKTAVQAKLALDKPAVRAKVNHR